VVASARVRRPDRPKPVARSREGSVQVLDVQRARILAAMAQVVAEDGGAGAVTVARVVSRAGVSRRTFYDLFDGCEDCFLAVFEDALARASNVAVEAAGSARSAWHEQIRAGLCALLAFFDEEPALGSLLVVDALGAGPEVLQQRARVLESLAAIIEEGRSATGNGRRASPAPSPPLAAEGVVGAVLSVIHARMLARRAYASTLTTGGASHATNGASRTLRERAPAPLIELLNPLMGVIVLPYLGQAAARRELERPAPAWRSPRAPRSSRASTPQQPPSPANPLAGLNMRVTYRTLQVLAAIANAPGASNREIADGAGVHDQGQISKLLTRLERLGLVHNTGAGQAKGEPNAWTLTSQGQQVEQALTPGH
jgi:AcrR family transcriptional regulator/DNA-binding MarR family transcriptional regulator